MLDWFFFPKIFKLLLHTGMGQVISYIDNSWMSNWLAPIRLFCDDVMWIVSWYVCCHLVSKIPHLIIIVVQTKDTRAINYFFPFNFLADERDGKEDSVLTRHPSERSGTCPWWRKVLQLHHTWPEAKHDLWVEYLWKKPIRKWGCINVHLLHNYW